MPSSQNQLDEGKLRLAGAFAIYLLITTFIAYWIGTEDVGYLYYTILLGGSLVCVIGLQRRAWILILLGWSLTGSTAMLGLPLSVRDIAVVVTFFAYLAHRALSQRNPVYPKCILDRIIMANVVYLVWTFALHPVGLHSLGAEFVGARPYASIALALVGYYVIWRFPSSIKTVSYIPLFILVGSAVTTSLSALAYFLPSLPSKIPYLYAALNVDAYFSASAATYEEAGGHIMRYKEFGFFGVTILTMLFAYTPSLTILNPFRLRFYALAGGLTCVLLSGFRGALATVCAMFGIGVWLNQGFVRFLITCAIGGALMLTLTLGQGNVYDLPLSVQRALAFLPGDWDPLVVRDVEGSTAGRVKWWEDAIRYNLIKDWWFGDGFGASARDVWAATGSATAMAETTGAYHSGPLTAIRYVGVIGLFLFYVLAIAAAVYACRCFQRSRGTRLQPLATYLAIQLIWYPIANALIFGAYNTDMPELIFLVALLRLLIRMLDEQVKMPADTADALSSISPSRVPVAT
jgi:hypothetical protein